MKNYQSFYIDGCWQAVERATMPVINPATEQVSGQISLAEAQDVNNAVQAAQRAFVEFSQSTIEQRLELLQNIVAEYQKNSDQLAAAVTEEMGAPHWLASKNQVTAGLLHFKSSIDILRDFKFQFKQQNITIRKEPIGVCGFITPWNWPLNQIGCKLAPALATGCTAVWKPSEIAPFSAYLLMQILHDAGVPKGVVNMVNGTGPVAGSAISAHPDIQMVSFTGSTRAGIAVAQDAAPTIKRVTQELGGKSPNIILDDLSEQQFAKAVGGGVKTLCLNSGQNCNAPSRMLVPQSRLQEAEAIVKQTMQQQIVVGEPSNPDTYAGPVVSETQWQRIQKLIASGIDQGAKLITGGLGKPQGLEQGYYVKPTAFSEVDNHMEIAQQEIFGPVLCLIPYQDEQQAIELANDTPYGLAGYVSGADPRRLKRVAHQIRAGMIHFNGAIMDRTAPFGGYKHSGNGRERGPQGFEEFLEIKTML